MVFFVEQGIGWLFLVFDGVIEIFVSNLNKFFGVVVSGIMCLVVEEGVGRVVKVVKGGIEIVLDGLQ